MFSKTHQALLVHLNSLILLFCFRIQLKDQATLLLFFINNHKILTQWSFSHHLQAQVFQLDLQFKKIKERFSIQVNNFLFQALIKWLSILILYQSLIVLRCHFLFKDFKLFATSLLSCLHDYPINS